MSGVAGPGGMCGWLWLVVSRGVGPGGGWVVYVCVMVCDYVCVCGGV